jgi:hypothetical protein
MAERMIVLDFLANDCAVDLQGAAPLGSEFVNAGLTTADKLWMDLLQRSKRKEACLRRRKLKQHRV